MSEAPKVPTTSVIAVDLVVPAIEVDRPFLKGEDIALYNAATAIRDAAKTLDENPGDLSGLDLDRYEKAENTSFDPELKKQAIGLLRNAIEVPGRMAEGFRLARAQRSHEPLLRAVGTEKDGISHYRNAPTEYSWACQMADQNAFRLLDPADQDALVADAIRRHDETMLKRLAGTLIAQLASYLEDATTERREHYLTLCLKLPVRAFIGVENYGGRPGVMWGTRISSPLLTKLIEKIATSGDDRARRVFANTNLPPEPRAKLIASLAHVRAPAESFEAMFHLFRADSGQVFLQTLRALGPVGLSAVGRSIREGYASKVDGCEELRRFIEKEVVVMRDSLTDADRALLKNAFPEAFAALTDPKLIEEAERANSRRYGDRPTSP